MCVLVLLARTAFAQSVPDVRTAVDRALPVFQRSAAAFVAKRSCVSCHHNVLPILVLHLAGARGFSIDARVLAAVEGTTFRQLRGSHAVDEAVQAVGLSDPTPIDSSLFLDAHAAVLHSNMNMSYYV
jgi:hypothetical protein